MKEEKSIQNRFPVKSFRKIPNPFVNSENSGEAKPEMYEIIADVMDLPTNFPMETNPRFQNLDTKVAKRIKDSLLDPTQRNFYLLNRGILLSASSVGFDNVNSMVTIDFENLQVHGNVDGGHTYKVILENRSALKRGQQFVRLEVLTGIEDIFESLAAARNTSLQVKDKSIGDLEGRFELIKQALSGQTYANDINYKENGTNSIDIQDVLSMFYMFNLERFPNGSSSYPVSAYSAKRVCTDEYLNAHKKYEAENQIGNPYYKMTRIMPSILNLYDEIEVSMAEFYKADLGGATYKKYGAITGVALAKAGKKFQSKYLKRSMDYATPNGFIYPILGAFRALLVERNGFYEWKTDPVKLLHEIGPTLVTNTVEMSRQLGNNPNATGKSTNLWNQLYMNVLVKVLGMSAN